MRDSKDQLQLHQRREEAKEKKKKTEMLEKEREAFTDNTALILQSKSGIQFLMKKTNEWMEQVTELGGDGHFTYLGWTTNLCLDWNRQVKLLKGTKIELAPPLNCGFFTKAIDTPKTDETQTVGRM
ncbi:hypothetical protein PROFUN_15370 [Planoprotostelium fungivorum]|uniref:Uncharacterized protein n=1 Tax=Planoprotostelium fungivorum TaxID=1890364 RepID=A0A2P6MW40_9EUKA|nr:hypothetical protein PROFUN_15370 [Planoprotostelium fungivorum]